MRAYHVRIAFSFQHLNRVDANAGASYSWATKIFSPGIGFIAGWSVMISSILFMVSGTIPAATATLALTAPSLIDDLGIVNLVAGVWVLVIGIIVAKGIKLTSYTQIAFTVMEVGVLLLLIVLALLEFGAMPAHPMVLGWFTGAGFTPTLFATGALTALFLFAGWDVTSNLNEETRDAQRIAGQGSIWAMVIVTALFLGSSVLTLLVLSDDEIAGAGTNILFVAAQKLLPHPLGRCRGHRGHAQHGWRAGNIDLAVHPHPVCNGARRGPQSALCNFASGLSHAPCVDDPHHGAGPVDVAAIVVPAQHKRGDQGFDQCDRLSNCRLLRPRRARLCMALPPRRHHHTGQVCFPRRLAIARRGLSVLHRALQRADLRTLLPILPGIGGIAIGIVPYLWNKLKTSPSSRDEVGRVAYG